jgi:hypothetical protein
MPKGGARTNLAVRPDKWVPRAQSLATASPYSFYKCEESEVWPPIVLPSSFLWSRERRGSEGRRTSRLVRSPWSSSSVEALQESVQVRRRFPFSSSVECGSSAGILRIPIESRLSSPSDVLGF